MPTQTITQIRITTEGRSWQATLENLVCEDEETRAAEYEIRKALSRGQTYNLGGGAAPLFTLAADGAQTTNAMPSYEEVLAALRALVENPRPAMGSQGSTWNERYARYERAFTTASAIVRRTA